jgi:tetratricopeptide (TPR) repeat protein
VEEGKNMTGFGRNGVTAEANYLYQQARRKVDDGEYQQAATMLHRAVEISPTFCQAFNELGICYENLNKNEDAVGFYEKAIKVDPSHADAWFNKGMNLKKLGRDKESMPCIERAIELYCGR